MCAPFVPSRKLEEDISPLHWLTGFDTVVLQALVPFAHGRPAQKTILSSLMIIKRTFDATFVTVTSRNNTEKDYSPIPLFSHRHLPYLKVRVTSVTD